MNDRVLLFLGVLGFFAVALALLLRPVPQPVNPVVVEIPTSPIITSLGNDRFMVTNVNPKSGEQGRYIVISLTSEKPQVLAEGNWGSLLRK